MTMLARLVVMQQALLTQEEELDQVLVVMLQVLPTQAEEPQPVAVTVLQVLLTQEESRPVLEIEPQLLAHKDCRPGLVVLVV